MGKRQGHLHIIEFMFEFILYQRQVLLRLRTTNLWLQATGGPQHSHPDCVHLLLHRQQTRPL